MSRADVVLVSMPWAPIWCPSLQLGVVQRVVERAGVSVVSHHYNLELFNFLADVRPGLLATAGAYDRFSNSGPLARWAFAVPPYDDEEAAARFARLVAHLYPDGVPEEARDKVACAAAVREAVPAFLERCVAEILDRDPKVVGFSCSFRQRVPSLVLAKLLEQRRPDLAIVFGGTYMAGVMGVALLETHPWVDVVVRGEAEPVAGRLFRELVAGEPITPQPGLVVRHADGTVAVHDESDDTTDLGSLPVPEFADYFARLRPSANVFSAIPIEGSRGCWWWKTKCKFCGVRDRELRYRRRTPADVRDEVLSHAARYRANRFFFVDSIIEPASLEDLLEELRAPGHDFTFWVQAKPNFTRAQVARLARLGLDQIFVGIESLSTPVLRLVRKGITTRTAVRMLKWGTELGMKVTWNLLYGFPGEQAHDYARMADLMASLGHLNPPFGLLPVELDRSSVYFDDAPRYGIAIDPCDPWVDPILEHAVRRGRAPAVADLAGCFPFRVATPTAAGTPELAACREALATWYRVAKESRLWCERGPGFMKIHDERANLAKRVHVLDELEARTYLACERGIALEHLMLVLADEGLRATRADVAGLLERWTSDRLIIEDEGRYLSLAIAPRSSRPTDTPAIRPPRRLPVVADGGSTREHAAKRG